MRKTQKDASVVKKSKKGVIKTVALSALLASAMTTVAFAAEQNMQHGGRAYLYSNYSNGMRNVNAGTERGNSVQFARLIVTTTYQNGDQYTYDSKVKQCDQKYNPSSYEWSEDYVSTHQLYTSVTNCFDTVHLAES